MEDGAARQCNDIVEKAECELPPHLMRPLGYGMQTGRAGLLRAINIHIVSARDAQRDTMPEPIAGWPKEISRMNMHSLAPRIPQPIAERLVTPSTYGE